jgi:hypothetical protein
MSDHQNDQEVRKAEIMNISTALYDLLSEIEERYLKSILSIELLVNAIFYIFDFDGELFLSTANILLCFVFFFLLTKIKNRQKNLSWLIDKVRRNFVISAMVDRNKFIDENVRIPLVWVLFAQKGSSSKRAWLVTELKNKIADYQPGNLIKAVGFLKSQSNTSLNLPLRTVFYVLFLLSIAVVFAAMNTDKDVDGKPITVSTHPNTNISMDSILYALSLKQANIPREEKICKTLVEINDNTLKDLEHDTIKLQRYIRVYTFKDKDYYSSKTHDSGFYNTKNFYTWVFTKREFFEKYKVVNEDSIHRVKQLLGLPAIKQIDYAISFLVRPEDLFRPCYDSEITDGQCNVDLAKSPSFAKRFVAEQYNRSYNNPSLFDNCPFTALGYTFDWNPYNFSHVGVSEFVINRFREVKLVGVENIRDFLRKGPE